MFKQLCNLDFDFEILYKLKKVYTYKVKKRKPIFIKMPLIPVSIQKQKRLSLQFNYKNLVRSRFRQQVDRIVSKYQLQELVLVVNLTTALLISNLFTIPELVEMKIIYLQRLEVKRKRMTTLHALYFLSPTIQCIEMLRKDFPQKAFGQQKSKNQYKKIHIFFTSFISKNLLKQIATHKPLLKRIATNSIKQFYHSSRFLSNTIIDFGMQNYGSLAFSKDTAQENQQRIRISEKIMQLVVNFGQLNTVRMYYKKSANMISERVGEYAQKTINKYIGNLLESKSYLLKPQADDITIMIFDRSLDPVTSLLHSFTYEALLFDLLKVAFQGSQLLQNKQYYHFKDFDDDTYHAYRYEHISKALQEIPILLNKENQKLMQLQKPSSSTNKLQQNDVDITQLTEQIKKLRTHIQLLDTLYQELKNKQLTQLAELEMSLATGLTEEGKNTSSSALFNQVIENIENNKKLSNSQKLRLAILTLCCIKLSKKDYQLLLSKFTQQQEKDTLKNIIALGITYDKNISKSTKAITKDQQNIATQRMQRTNMPLDRHTPIMQLVIPTVVQILSGQNTKKKRLDESLFGCFKSSWLQDQKLDIIKFSKQRFVIVMLGGMSYAEISSIRRSQGLKDVIIAADTISSPQDYLSLLKNIDILKQREN